MGAAEREESEGSSGRSRSQAKGRGRAAGRRTRGARAGGGSAQPLTDHEQIRQWAEERGGTPACVRGTGGHGDIGMLRIDFPGYSGEQSLQPISWEDWFAKFDERNLSLIVQEKTGRGQKSNFNKLIKREGGGRSARPRTRAAG
jgi:hypothetical protein